MGADATTIDNLCTRTAAYFEGRAEMPPNDKRLTFTVPEVAARLGLSRNGVYMAILAKQIPAIRIGRRILVPQAAFQRMLEQADAA